jgi:hypothetical protein
MAPIPFKPTDKIRGLDAKILQATAKSTQAENDAVILNRTDRRILEAEDYQR